jgi:hypothetical protein
VGSFELYSESGYEWRSLGTISGSPGAPGQDAPDTFIGLSDTPNNYDVGKYLRATASGIEFATVSGSSGGSVYDSFISLSDTSTTYSGTEGQYLISTGSGIEFAPQPARSTDVLYGKDYANIDPTINIGKSYDFYLKEDGDLWRKQDTIYANVNSLTHDATITSENTAYAVENVLTTDSTYCRCNRYGYITFTFDELKAITFILVLTHYENDPYYIKGSVLGDFSDSVTLFSYDPTSYSQKEFILDGTKYKAIRFEAPSGSTDFRNIQIYTDNELAYSWQFIQKVSEVSNFLDLTDTPTTYSGIEGNYLRVTASGIQAVDGVVLTAPDLSEWVLKVTVSGVLYTEAYSG